VRHHTLFAQFVQNFLQFVVYGHRGYPRLKKPSKNGTASFARFMVAQPFSKQRTPTGVTQGSCVSYGRPCSQTRESGLPSTCSTSLTLREEAKEMLGRTYGNLRVVKPMKDGVIADFKVTEKMLNYFIQKAHQRRTLVHPRVVISVPSEVTQVEKRAVTDAAYRAKAAEVHLVEQAMMAAIGAGLPVTEPGGNKVTSVSRAAKHFRKLASIVPSWEDACRSASL
jgi:hypothetical protein